MARQSVSVVEWLEHLLHPWTSFVILPLFALANAGIPSVDRGRLSRRLVADHLRRGPGSGGGQAGRDHRLHLDRHPLRIGVLPAEATWRGIVGVAALAGIGFTVSIFVTGLAFSDAGVQDEAKIGILAASLAAAVLGSVILVIAGPKRSRPTSSHPAHAGRP